MGQPKGAPFKSFRGVRRYPTASRQRQAKKGGTDDQLAVKPAAGASDREVKRLRLSMGLRRCSRSGNLGSDFHTLRDSAIRLLV